jgi:hypothetical protein
MITMGSIKAQLSKRMGRSLKHCHKILASRCLLTLIEENVDKGFV